MTKTSASIILSVVLAAVPYQPAAAQLAHFNQSEPIATVAHDGATLKILQDDGVIFSEPLRAVVVSGDGRLLAASPISASLRIICEGADRTRSCLAYDDLTRTVYQPVERDWRDGGLIEQDGEAQANPEDLTADFGFAQRPATFTEIIRFELAGIVSSWWTTGVALAWWTMFWLLLLPVARFFLRRGEPQTIGTLVMLLMRTAAALLMIPVTAYAWLMAPYSAVYLSVVVAIGAAAAYLVTGRRGSPSEARSAS